MKTKKWLIISIIVLILTIAAITATLISFVVELNKNDISLQEFGEIVENADDYNDIEKYLNDNTDSNKSNKSNEDNNSDESNNSNESNNSSGDNNSNDSNNSNGNTNSNESTDSNNNSTYSCCNEDFYLYDDEFADSNIKSVLGEEPITTYNSKETLDSYLDQQVRFYRTASDNAISNETLDDVLDDKIEYAADTNDYNDNRQNREDKDDYIERAYLNGAELDNYIENYVYNN